MTEGSSLMNKENDIYLLTTDVKWNFVFICWPLFDSTNDNDGMVDLYAVSCASKKVIGTSVTLSLNVETYLTRPTDDPTL